MLFFVFENFIFSCSVFLRSAAAASCLSPLLHSEMNGNDHYRLHCRLRGDIGQDHWMILGRNGWRIGQKRRIFMLCNIKSFENAQNCTKIQIFLHKSLDGRKSCFIFAVQKEKNTVHILIKLKCLLKPVIVLETMLENHESGCEN